MIRDETTIPQLMQSNKIRDIPVFYLQGGVAPEKLSNIKRKILSMVASTVEKAGATTEEDWKLIDVLRIGGDYVKEENLNEIFAFIGQNTA